MGYTMVYCKTSSLMGKIMNKGEQSCCPWVPFADKPILHGSVLIHKSRWTFSVTIVFALCQRLSFFYASLWTYLGEYLWPIQQLQEVKAQRCNPPPACSRFPFLNVTTSMICPALQGRSSFSQRQNPSKSYLHAISGDPNNPRIGTGASKIPFISFYCRVS